MEMDSYGGGFDPEGSFAGEKEQAVADAKMGHLSRQQRRTLEREEAKNVPRETERAQKAAEALSRQLGEVLDKYCSLVNRYQDKQVKFQVFLDPVQVNLNELPPHEQTHANVVAAIDKMDPSKVNVMYFRVDKHILFHDGPPKARPGFVEQVVGNELVQLFHHGLVPLKDDSKLTVASAREKILNEFMLNLVFFGLDAIQLNNEQGQMRAAEKKHTEVEDKVKAFDDTISEMKINKDTDA